MSEQKNNIAGKPSQQKMNKSDDDSDFSWPLPKDPHEELVFPTEMPWINE